MSGRRPSTSITDALRCRSLEKSASPVGTTCTVCAEEVDSAPRSRRQRLQRRSDPCATGVVAWPRIAWRLGVQADDSLEFIRADVSKVVSEIVRPEQLTMKGFLALVQMFLHCLELRRTHCCAAVMLDSMQIVSLAQGFPMHVARSMCFRPPVRVPAVLTHGEWETLRPIVFCVSISPPRLRVCFGRSGVSDPSQQRRHNPQGSSTWVL